MEQLQINEKTGANYILLELEGTINNYTVLELQTKLYTNIKTTNVVLELSQIEEIDSTGVGTILAGYNDALDSKTKMYIMNPSPVAREALEDTGFISLFDLIHSVTEVV